MNEKKKPYEPPKIYRVELNQDQAILAACMVGTTAISTPGTGGCTVACRRLTTTGGNSAARPS